MNGGLAVEHSLGSLGNSRAEECRFFNQNGDSISSQHPSSDTAAEDPTEFVGPSPISNMNQSPVQRSPASRFMHSAHSQTREARASDVEQRISLERNLSDIAGEFPAQRDRSGDQAPEGINEYQDPMWLMAGLAERGWTLQRTSSGNKKEATDGRLAPTTLQFDEEWLFHKWTPQALQLLETEQTRYYQHGSLGSKCDVAAELDPIQHGLIGVERAEQLFHV